MGRVTLGPIRLVPLVLLIAAAGRLAATSSALSNAGDVAAIVAATIALVLLLWAIGDWLRRRIRDTRASRTPQKVFGKLDYAPEFVRAIEQYVAAQEQITTATVRCAEALSKYQPFETQEQAEEAAVEAVALCKAFDEHLPVMRDRATVARQCLRGALSVTEINSEADIEAGRSLRGLIRGNRVATEEYRRSVKNAKAGAAALRKQNMSLSVNEPVEDLQQHLENAIHIARGVRRGMRAAERQIGRRLLWHAIRSRLRRARRAS